MGTLSLTAGLPGLRMAGHLHPHGMRGSFYDERGETVLLVELLDDGRARLVIYDMVDGQPQKRTDATLDTLCSVEPCGHELPEAA